MDTFESVSKSVVWLLTELSKRPCEKFGAGWTCQGHDSLCLPCRASTILIGNPLTEITEPDYPNYVAGKSAEHRKK